MTEVPSPLGAPILPRPRSTIIYGTPVVTAQVHVTATETITKDFRYDPIPGAGNARVANEAAQAWVAAMEKELGYVPARPEPRAPTLEEFLGGLPGLVFLVLFFCYVDWKDVLLRFIGMR